MITDYYQKKPTDDPGAVTPVSITALATVVAGSQVTITWTTSKATSSQVQYGVSPPDGWQDNVTAETDTNPTVTSHTVIITGLVTGKNYWFRVRSRYSGGKDGMGNSVMDGYVFSAYGTFTT